MNYVLISGTNRENSVSQKFTEHTRFELEKRLRADDQIQMIHLCEIPTEIFNPRAYAEKPASFQRYMDIILAADAILSVIPEYNGSAPGAYKYFIDMLPFPQSLQGVACGFVGISAGRLGGVRAVEHMQDVFQYRNALVYPKRVFINFINDNLDDNAKPTEELTLKVYDEMLDGFVDFTRRIRS